MGSLPKHELSNNIYNYGVVKCVNTNFKFL